MTYQTDICIIGAGPVGIFSVFQCGMLGMKCHVVDSLDMIGGQCSALYPEKPIYDIPAYPHIDAQNLVDNLHQQADPFKPVYHLSQSVTGLTGDVKNGFVITTSNNIVIQAKAIIIAAGAGAFGPNKPPLKDLALYEGKSVFYMVKNRQDFKDKNIVIAGGGDSAVDWAVSLSYIASAVSVVHRRDTFRAAPDTVAKMRDLADQGKINLIVPAQPIGLKGNEDGILEAVCVRDNNQQVTDIACDVFLPFYGLAANLGAITQWNLNIKKNHIVIDQATSQTNQTGIYAIGDIATYEHKLKLILTGFAEAAAAAHHAYGIIFDGKALHFEYSTGKGIPAHKPETGFGNEVL
ncbi:MAG: thioredoxin reductase (NADPH) [Alphaproteobacteria bacterium]|jgi:thioredoxin reductase (NADPH)